VDGTPTDTLGRISRSLRIFETDRGDDTSHGRGDARGCIGECSLKNIKQLFVIEKYAVKFRRLNDAISILDLEREEIGFPSQDICAADFDLGIDLLPRI
jgi:hypothetical protein